MRAVISLLTGNEIVEVKGNNNNQLLMVKSDAKTEPLFIYVKQFSLIATLFLYSAQLGADIFL